MAGDSPLNDSCRLTVFQRGLMIAAVKRLSPTDVVAYYTLEQIEAKIAEYEQALDDAVTGSYRLDTTSVQQAGNPPDPDQIASILQVWLGARALKTGTTPTRLFTGNYRPR